MLFQKMRNSKSGAKNSAVTAIERKKLVGGPVAQQMLHPMLDITARPGCPEAVAFQAEEGDLIERIDDAKSRIEFKAVYYPHLVVEPNMFGAQITMSIHDAAMAQT
ncbi:MAG: hypothetical protein WB522_10925, partial [Pseudolabrys sp.]